MDIRKWLGETVQPETISKYSPELIRSKHVNSAARRRNRVHDTSDSSLLEPFHRRTSVSPNECNHLAGRDANNHIECEDLRSICGHSSSINDSPQRYARRSRHKTRLERYEPSHIIAGEEKDARRADPDESKKSRRKRKQKPVGKPGNKTTHEFHAKNVSTDRLTLRPSENIGIFNKGKASTQIKGHGCGFTVPMQCMAQYAADQFEVPDLVFSEMAFLKKKEGDSEPVARVAASNKRQRRDHAHNKEEEISAFFTSVRPTLADANRKRQATSDHQSTRVSKSQASSNRKQVRERELEESSIVVGVAPTVEKQGNVPYLDPSGGLSQGHTSQTSCSESHCTLSRTPGFVRITPTIDADCSGSAKHKRGTADTEHLPYPSAMAAQKKDHDIAELLRVSSVKFMRDDVAKSQPCPPSMSSSRGLDPKNGSERRCVVHNGTLSVVELPNLPIFPSIETQSGETINASKNPETKSGSSTGLQSTSAWRQETLPSTMEDVGVHARTSSLGLVLQECSDAVNRQQCKETSTGKDFRRAVRFHSENEGTWHDHFESKLVAQEDRNILPSEPNLHSSRVPSFAGPSIYELQEQRHGTRKKIHLDPDCFVQGIIIDGDEDGFDGENWEGLVIEEPMGYDAVHASRRADERDVDHGYAPIVQAERLPMAESHIGMSRFWRPNKLY